MDSWKDGRLTVRNTTVKSEVSNLPSSTFDSQLHIELLFRQVVLSQDLKHNTGSSRFGVEKSKEVEVMLYLVVNYA